MANRYKIQSGSKSPDRFANKGPAGAAKSEQDVILDSDLQLLTQIGFSAVVQGLSDDARPIFDALQEWAPSSSAATIGMALTRMLNGNLEEAISMLKRDGINKKNGGDEAKGILLIALQLAGRQTEAQALKRDVARSAGPAQQLTSLLP